MAHQYSTAVRNAKLDAVESTVGTSAILKIRTGAAPATPATADSGTVLATINLPSDWMAAASGGTKALAGTWSDSSADATGTAGHYRIYDSGGSTCGIQGNVYAQVQIATNGTTSANSNVLNFASTTGVQVGMVASGTGVVDGSTVLAVGASTVTLSHASTAGVGSAVTISFKGDITLDSVSITAGQTVTITAYTLTAGNA